MDYACIFLYGLDPGLCSPVFGQWLVRNKLAWTMLLLFQVTTYIDMRGYCFDKAGEVGIGGSHWRALSMEKK